MTAEHWKDQPEGQDFPAAESFLALLVGTEEATKLVKRLRKQGKQGKQALQRHPAKDILRASGLPLLAKDDPEVAADLTKVGRGERLSPVLLVSGEPLWVADGYHRVCASYYVNEKAEVPCRVTSRKRS